MKNIFKETDNLTKNYGGIQLTGEDLVLYEHNKKSIWAAFVYYLCSFGLQRFYLADKFSKRYGFFFLVMEAICFNGEIKSKLINNYYNNLFDVIIVSFAVIAAFLYIIDLFLLIPFVKRNNLLLKKTILEKSSVLKDRGSYRIQEVCSIFVLIAMIMLRWFISLLS